MADSAVSALRSMLNLDPSQIAMGSTQPPDASLLSPAPMGGGSLMPSSVPLPPPRPQGLLAGPIGDDSDMPVPGAAPAGPAPMPLAPHVPPQPVPGAGGAAMPVAAAASAPTAGPGAAGAAPDMMAMYSQLLSDNTSKANFDSGLALIGAGLSGSDQARAGLMNMAAQSGPASAQNQTINSLNAMVQLRKYGQAQAQQTAQQGRLPAIAAQLNIPVATAQYLDTAGKLDDLVTQASKPNMEIKTYNDGSTVLINKTTGAVVQNYGGAKADDAGPKQTALLNDVQTNWQKYGLPDPSSTDPKDVQTWNDYRQRILTGGGGINVSVNNTPEKAEAAATGQAIGAAKGKEIAAYIDDGNPALKQIQLLDTMSGALKASNGQYTGPFADYALNAKQGLAGAFGLDLNLAPQETAQKLGFQLATQASKAISARPSQAEFLRALQNVPGIFQTPQGADALISINKQDAQDRVALSNLAHNAKPGDNMNQIAQQYYASHPIMSPFHPGEYFGQADMNQIAGAAAANGQRGAAAFVRPTPNAAAIADLRSNPANQQEFDEHFGTGTSYHYLHGNGAQ